MHMDDHTLLIFEVGGEYGHFRKFNTTTSPLTYALPTRVALAGLIGAILGIARETAPGLFPPGVVPTQELLGKPHCQIGVQLLHPIVRTVIGFNLIETKKSFFEINNRIQIPFEMLKNPRFRVFFWHESETIRNELAHRLKERDYHFTPYLGLSQCTATVDYQGTVAFTRETGDGEAFHLIQSALNLNQMQAAEPVRFEEDFYFITETMPITMQPDRVVSEYGEVLLEAQGRPIEAKVTEWIAVGGYGNIVFL